MHAPPRPVVVRDDGDDEENRDAENRKLESDGRYRDLMARLRLPIQR